MDDLDDEDQIDSVEKIDIYGCFVSSDDPRFQEMYAPQITKLPGLDKEDIVLPVFYIEDMPVLNGDIPSEDLEDIVQEQIRKSLTDGDRAKIIEFIKNESIENMDPVGEPSTEKIRIGYIAVDKDNMGMIASVSPDKIFDGLKN